MPSPDHRSVHAALEASLESALRDHDLERLRELLVPLEQIPEARRTTTERLILHRTLGQLHDLEGRAEAATPEYLSAYSVDSRDKATLDGLAARIFTGDLDLPSDRASLVLKRLMIFHWSALEDEVIARSFRVFGERAQAKGELRFAERCYERALEASPGDVEIIRCFLGVMEISDDPNEVKAVRERLIDSTPDAAGRAAVLVMIGDDQRARHELDEALASYERAVSEYARGREALERVHDLSIEREDWAKAARALALQSRLDEAVEDRIAKLEEAARLYLDHLDARIDAVRLYNHVLDLQPLRLKTFARIRDLLTGSEDWTRLERNDAQMASRLEALGDDAEARAALIVVYTRLAALRQEQLERPLAAAEVFERLVALQPGEASHIRALAEIYQHYRERLPEAQQAFTLLLNATTDDEERLELIGKLAKIYEVRRMYDRAYCMLRVLDSYDRADERSAQFVKTVAQRRAWPPLKAPLDAQAWREIEAPGLDPVPSRLFALAFPALLECYSDDLLETYNLRAKKDALDLGQRTLFATTYGVVAEALGFDTSPRVFLHQQEPWLRNAYVSPPSLLLGSGLLSGRGREDLAFVCGKALALMRPEFYLIGRGDHRGLLAILKTFIQIFRPDFGGALTDRGQQRIAKAVRRLGEDAQLEMREIIDRLIEDGASTDLARWINAATRTANRIGFLLCDDLQTAARALNEEASVKRADTRVAQAHIADLVQWSISEPYMALRERLGLAFKKK